MDKENDPKPKELRPLNDEEIARELAHIDDLKLSISTLEKLNAETTVNPEAYECELKGKIIALETAIKGIKYDLENQHSLKLAIEKVFENNKKIDLHRKNMKAHQYHIDKGV